MANRVAIIGLGLMGGTLSQHFLDGGLEVIGFDPDADRRAEHEARGARVAEQVAACVADVDVVVLSLPNSTIMLEVCNDIVESGATVLVIDTTTGDPEDSLQAYGTLTASGSSYVDATVSGNAAQFAEKDVIFMIGGDPADVVTASALLTPLGRHVYEVGPVASGSRAKLVVNHVLSVNRTAVAEGLAVAEKAGVDLDSMLEILRDSAAYSKAMDIWGDRMVAADHYPPASRVRQSNKDSRLINAHAESVGAAHELVAVVNRYLTEAEETGLADADNSAAIEIMRRRGGIGRIPLD